MRGRPRSWLAVPTLLAAVLVAGCTGGRVGPVVHSGEPRPEPPPADIVDVLEADEAGRFETLLALLAPEDDPDASDAELARSAALREATSALVEVLTGTGPVTLFAPTDEAFAALGTPAQLAADPAGVAQLLATHITEVDVSLSVPPYVTDGLVDGRTPPEDAGLVIVEDGVTLVPTLSGVDLVVDGSAQEVSIRDSGAPVEVTDPDIQAPNGFIQVLGGVLVPPPPATPAP